MGVGEGKEWGEECSDSVTMTDREIYYVLVTTIGAAASMTAGDTTPNHPTPRHATTRPDQPRPDSGSPPPAEHR